MTSLCQVGLENQSLLKSLKILSNLLQEVCMNSFDWLVKWYASNCDGNWEHMYQVRIYTVDNPGWRVEIDIAETIQQDKKFEPVYKCEDEDNWIICEVKNDVFYGNGDTSKLESILGVFRQWCG